MLDFGSNRRDFLRIGGIGAGMSAMGLSDAALAEEEPELKDSSVVWVWLGGGPTQFETFHAPKEDSVPAEYRSVGGSLVDKASGMAFGSHWQDLIKQAPKLNVIDSFTHGDSSHRQATHWMMTSHRNNNRAQTSSPMYPSHGSIVSSIYGANHPDNGVPCYVKQGRIEGEDPSWLGGAYKPFDPSNKDNLTPRVDIERFTNRNELLKSLEGINISGSSADSVTKFNNQAFDVIMGTAKDAFNLDKEDEKIKARYGKDSIGQQLLLARRLCEFGTRFVTVHYGGWDMHGNIANALKGRVPPLDKALAAFVEDVHQRGLNEKILLIVTGEFGRTKLNANAGRDHWSSSTPMLMSGGRYDGGRVIGKADKSYTPSESPYGPIDVAATMFDHFGIDKKIMKVDNSGRPRYLLEGEAKVIL
ncbi:hypothetical protein CMI37_01545 [Candidatus Pacearchaeota archaeon]|nr:hypothetical protein [Candidatus Pacearchaeota archaeon]